MNSTEEKCPICLREYSLADDIIKDSIANYNLGNNTCTHWFCTDCLTNLYKYKIYNCPVCRVCIAQLIMSYSPRIRTLDQIRLGDFLNGAITCYALTHKKDRPCEAPKCNCPLER